MMTDDMNAEFRVRLAERRTLGEGVICAKRTVLRLMLEHRRQQLVDYLEGRHYREAGARGAFSKLHAEVTLLLIAMESCR